MMPDLMLLYLHLKLAASFPLEKAHSFRLMNICLLSDFSLGSPQFSTLASFQERI